MVVAIVILGILGLMIASPTFRKVAFVLLSICGIAVAVFLIVIYRETQTFEREQEAARHRVAPNEIDLTQVTLDYRSGRLEGRLYNRSSDFAVSELGLKVIMQDCDSGQLEHDPAGLRACDTIGDYAVRLSKLTPPGQARDFSEYAFFSAPTPRRGTLRWHYSIDYIEARPPSEP